MIVMRLKGGLGNQLFQYALGRHLSIAKNTHLQLDISSFKTDTLREYRLDSFKISATTSARLPFFATDGKARHLNRLIQAIRGLFSRPFEIVTEKNFAFDPQILNCSDQAYIDGFWQSEQYFLPIANTLRKDLQLNAPIMGHLKEIADHIGSCTSVSVHVRRGDYVSNPKTTAYHGVCSTEWYESAAAKILEKVNNPTFFVFSDDCEWAKANLHFQCPTVFVEPSPDGQECIDMHVMSLCQHNIIANSSFSWWAAWLNANPNKIVIAPQNWFIAGPKQTNDLIPMNWLRI
jgi:hypothetical protein